MAVNMKMKTKKLHKNYSKEKLYSKQLLQNKKRKNVNFNPSHLECKNQIDYTYSAYKLTARDLFAHYSVYPPISVH